MRCCLIYAFFMLVSYAHWDSGPSQPLTLSLGSIRTVLKTIYIILKKVMRMAHSLDQIGYFFPIPYHKLTLSATVLSTTNYIIFFILIIYLFINNKDLSTVNCNCTKSLINCCVYKLPSGTICSNQYQKSTNIMQNFSILSRQSL